MDVDDTDEVTDVVIDRVLELHTEQGLPVHVIPLRPVKKVVEEMRAEAASGRRRHLG